MHKSPRSAISRIPFAALLAAGTPAAHLELAATGWLDTTRVAGGKVEIWREILDHNRDEVLASLKQYRALVDRFACALENNDFKTVNELFSEGKRKRDAVANRHSTGK